jgi:hydroxymethylglutaryl-CoA lyase
VLPQLADTAEIVAYARTLPGLQVAVLVPNFKGAENAIKSGAHKITIPLSCSETHSLKNVKRTHEQMFEETRKIAELIRSLPADQRPKFEGGLSTAFGCTLEGIVPQEKVVKIAETLIDCGCDEVGLSDTTGYANPRQLQALAKAVWAAIGKEKMSGVHMHNTRGQGLACILAAIDIGITTVDSSLGGIGGCPFAPGASGNVVTEDLVWMLEAMGLKTGINIEKLLETRRLVQAALPNEAMYGFIPDAGLPKGFVPASTF